MSQHLLMIEDDARLARMVSEYLGQSGFVVSLAGDGRKGLAAVGLGGQRRPQSKRLPHVQLTHLLKLYRRFKCMMRPNPRLPP